MNFYATKSIQSPSFFNLNDISLQLMYKQRQPQKEFKYKGEVRKASVLIPLCIAEEQPSALFTLRSSNLRSHRGQVSFPGGMWEPGDENDVATALRETCEEIYIPVGSIQVLGQHQAVPDRTKTIKVTPVIGFIGNVNVNTMKFNSDEVAKVFTVPISYLMDPTNQTFETFRGTPMRIPSWTIDQDKIWGLSAYLIWHFLKISD